MNALAFIGETRIAQAVQEGKLDNLPGAGCPLDLTVRDGALEAPARRAPPGPGYAQPAPRGGQGNLGRPCVSLRAWNCSTAPAGRRPIPIKTATKTVASAPRCACFGPRRCHVSANSVNRP
jgi:hypothetical protein